MTIKEIYNAFDAIGCLSFATVNENGEPEARIAHLRAYDEQGIYFMTMFTKDFYKQMKETGKVSINGLCASTEVRHDAEGFPEFERGYAIRLTGNVREIPMDEIKAKNNQLFDFCIKDYEQYPAMVVMCITSGRGDIFDYDFEKETRDNKLERKYFSFNGAGVKYKGLYIDKEICIGCGQCKKVCSFLAVDKTDEKYKINTYRCDECGDCYLKCPVDAISYDGGKK